jgi:hypothetical protein
VLEHGRRCGFALCNQMMVTGVISSVSGGEVLIRVPPRTFSHDVRVTLSDPKSAYDLQKDQRVTVRFTCGEPVVAFCPMGGPRRARAVTS